MRFLFGERRLERDRLKKNWMTCLEEDLHKTWTIGNTPNPHTTQVLYHSLFGSQCARIAVLGVSYLSF